MVDPKKDRTKEVLERLKAQEARPRAKLENNTSLKRPVAKKSSGDAPQSIYQLKIEKIINRLNEIERKMKHGNDYFTHYWDYSKTSKEFLDVIREFEKFDTSFIAPPFKKKVEEMRIKVQSHLSRVKETEPKTAGKEFEI